MLTKPFDKYVATSPAPSTIPKHYSGHLAKRQQDNLCRKRPVLQLCHHRIFMICMSTHSSILWKQIRLLTTVWILLEQNANQVWCLPILTFPSHSKHLLPSVLTSHCKTAITHPSVALQFVSRNLFLTTHLENSFATTFYYTQQSRGTAHVPIRQTQATATIICFAPLPTSFSSKFLM